MAKDGLIWRVFGEVNPRFHTPATGTVVLGVIIAVAASVLPLGVLGDLVSLGTALAFAIVCGSVIYLRRNNPTMKRPFQVPFYPYTPILGIFFCVVLMMGPILLDIVSKAMGYDLLGAMIGNPGKVEHDPIALGILATYALVGVFIYLFYGYRHSKLGIAASTPT
jgi:APA family basic amino acid/polyamine antiporter